MSTLVEGALDEDLLLGEPICEDDHTVRDAIYPSPPCMILARYRVSYACTHEVVLACEAAVNYIIRQEAVCSTCWKYDCMSITPL